MFYPDAVALEVNPFRFQQRIIQMVLQIANRKKGRVINNPGLIAVCLRQVLTLLEVKIKK